MEFFKLNQILLLLVATPGALFACLATAWILGCQGRERWLSRITGYTFFGLTIGAGILAWRMVAGGIPSVRIDLGNWFEVGDYGFPVALVVDRLSMPLVVLTILLVGLVGNFSSRYLHRDPGHFRFFLLMHLYAFGSLLLFTAGSLDLLIAGWELVGITSVLLIGFFHYRREPVQNAVRVFGTYRIADICLLVAIFLAHHWFGSGTWSDLFPGEWPDTSHAVTGTGANLLGVLLVLAACGKSSQGPFFGWLPRAMEGPTPSSAIFYGAISVHAGAYLILRIEPLLQSAPVARYLLMAIGVTTAIVATLIHRTCSDAKTGLAYASMTQLAVIFTEVSLGWTVLALVHIVGHAIVRTAQFLRAPSMLHDYHQFHAAAGGHVKATGTHYHFLVPQKLQLWLYSIGLERGRYDAIVDRFFLNPLVRLSDFLSRLEPSWMGGAGNSSLRSELPGNVNPSPTLSTNQPSDAHV
jgi:NADH:ubiquinone oxidoreductase subunit 5 (subunit L)/multisubunit Na+/H+ antiporter MnhA subunit